MEARGAVKRLVLVGSIFVVASAGACSSDDGSESSQATCATVAAGLCQSACVCGATCPLESARRIEFADQAACEAGVAARCDQIDITACSAALSGVACSNGALALPTACSGLVPSAGSAPDTTGGGADANLPDVLVEDVPVVDAPAPSDTGPDAIETDVSSSGACCEPNPAGGCPSDPACEACVCTSWAPCCDDWSWECVWVTAVSNPCGDACRCPLEVQCEGIPTVGCCTSDGWVEECWDIQTGSTSGLECSEAEPCGWDASQGRYTCGPQTVAEDPSGKHPRWCPGSEP